MAIPSEALRAPRPVLCIGALMVDMVCHVPCLPLSGEGIVASSLSYEVGGCAHNTACAIAELGLPVRLFAPLGSGPYADLLRKRLGSRGFDGFETNAPYDNGACLCMVEQDKEGDYAGRAGRQACRPFPQVGEPTSGNPPATTGRAPAPENDCERRLHTGASDYRSRGSTDDSMAEAMPAMASSLALLQSQTGAALRFFAGRSGLIRWSVEASGAFPSRPSASPAKHSKIGVDAQA